MNFLYNVSVPCATNYMHFLAFYIKQPENETLFCEFTRSFRKNTIINRHADRVFATGLIFQPNLQHNFNFSSGRKRYVQRVDASLLPLSLDLREYNLVSTVQDQGSCGSCYAMVGAHYLESLMLLQNSTYKISDWGSFRLSTQQLMDRSRSNSGCGGGDFVSLLFDVASVPIPILSEAQRPYKRAEIFGASSGAKVPFSDVEMLFSSSKSGFNQSVIAKIKAVISQGVPVAGAASVARQGFLTQMEFGAYAGGVFDRKCKFNGLDHQILLVGYGTFNGADVWVVKNSWGSGWGIEGFAYLPIGANSMCSEMYAAVAWPAEQVGVLGQQPANKYFNIQRGANGLDIDGQSHNYSMLGYLKIWEVFVYVALPAIALGIMSGCIKGQKERKMALKILKRV